MPSETGASGQAGTDVSDSAVRAQLERILASAVFSRSAQMRRLLTFLVEQRLIGRGHTLKEAVLAHEVYGKGADFDGGTDPVVRVDARRLRDKLREYYEGRSDPVVISLPKGSYVPVFEASQPRQQREPSDPRRVRMWVGAVAVVVAVATAGMVWRARGGGTTTAAELLPLASYPGVEGPPALSPDGSFVAFAWSGGDDSGPTDIYVKAVGSEALQRLTDTPAAESGPAWSPDGHSIAFVRDGPDRDAVVIMSRLGGDEREVSGSGTHVGWAADSKSVLIRDRAGNAGPYGIHQVFLDTLERRRLTQAPVGAGDWKFEVSPDGKTLGFIRYNRAGIADLYVVPMQGGEPRRLSNWNASLYGLSWTPDSREIVYAVEEPSAGRLWRIDANAVRPGRGVPITDIPAAAAHPSISRPAPGRPARLAFQTVTRDVDIYIMDLERPLVNDTIDSRPFANSTRVESGARFSPDGSRVAFVSSRSGGPEIWVAARDDGRPRQVTSLGAPEISVGGWSPDGAMITFDAAVDGNTDVYAVGADGGQLRRITSDAAVDGVPSWSEDGRSIYFSSTRAGVVPDVWRVSVDGGEAVRLTHNGGFEPRESTDRRYLYFLDRHPAGIASDGTARVMRAPVTGGHAVAIVEGVRPFLWALADTGILFLTREPHVDALDLYRFADQRVARLGRLPFRIPGVYRHLTVSRDGRWACASNMVRFDSDLMRLDNFR
jgi:Tol biopolymer transport system component